MAHIVGIVLAIGLVHAQAIKPRFEDHPKKRTSAQEKIYIEKLCEEAFDRHEYQFGYRNKSQKGWEKAREEHLKKYGEGPRFGFYQ